MLCVGPALPLAGMGLGVNPSISRGSSSHGWNVVPNPTFTPSAPAAVAAGMAGRYAPQYQTQAPGIVEPVATFSAGAIGNGSSAQVFQPAGAGVAGGGCQSTTSTLPATSVPNAPAGVAVSAKAAQPLASRGHTGCTSMGLVEEHPSTTDMFLPKDGQDGRSDRRPADPFFYPTTLRPLTSYGLNAIAGTTPPKVPYTDLFGVEGKASDEFKGLQSVPQPISTFVDSPEENQRLQEQNDNLARQVMALEHAKSLAAVQAAQRMRQIHARQEAMKRQAQVERQRAKEMQADFNFPALSTFGETTDSGKSGPTDVVRATTVDSHSSAPQRDNARQSAVEAGPGADMSLPPTERGTHQPQQDKYPQYGSDAQQLSQPTVANITRIDAGEARQSTTVMYEAASAMLNADPLRNWDGLVPAGSKAPAPDPADIPTVQNSVSTLPPQPIPPSQAMEVGDDKQFGAAAPPAGSSFPDQPQWNEDAWNPKRDEGGLRGSAPAPPLVSLGGVAGSPYRSGGSVGSDGTPESMPVPLPADGVPPRDTLTMANRILNAHYGSTAFTSVEAHAPPATAPPAGAAAQGYVDAMGNPLGKPIVLDLPNIRDEPPPEYAAGAERRPAPVAVPGADARYATAPAGTTDPWSGVASGADQNEAARASAMGMGTGEKMMSPTAPAEVSPLPMPPPEPPGSAAQERVAPASARSSSQAGSGSASVAAVSPAGTAVARPTLPPQPPRSSSQPPDAAANSGAPLAERPRPSKRDQSADNRRAASQSRRERQSVKDDVPSTPQGQRASSQPPEQQSEELQAELEECLDTISWCADSVTRESLQDLKNTKQPAPVIKDVLETVAFLIGQPETKWDKLVRVISAPTFPEKIKKLNPTKSVSREQFKKLRDRLQHPEFDEELIKTVCVPVVPLAMWCRAIGVYLSKTKFKGGPEIRPVAGAGAASPPPQPQMPGPKLQPPGAHMIFDPDLDRLSNEELRQVRELTISRPAVGEITFHGETDCTELDFERIVRLEIGEVLVYPDSTTKPPIGVGLNKPATVTMYQCWPPNTSKLLQDPRAQERYKKKIKQMTEEKHAKFIDYDCTTGVWKFSVANF